MEATQTTDREYYSLADLTQFEEEQVEGYRGDVDANASLPPVPHDVYLANIAYEEQDVDKRWIRKLAKDGKVMWMTFIRITTSNNADPSHDGRSWQEVLTTYPNKRGTTGVQALLQGFDVDTLMLNTHTSQMRAINNVIADGTALVGAELDWQARMFDKEAVAKDDKTGEAVLQSDGSEKKGVEVWSLKGMRNFPKNDDGTYRSEITVHDGYSLKTGEPLPDSLLPVRAFHFVRRWVPKSKLVRTEVQDGAAVSMLQNAAVVAHALVQQQLQSAQAAPVAAPPVRQAAAATAAPTATAPANRPAAPNRPPVRRVAQ